MQGHPGDTLASALLANGAGVIARSLKYHRPRGIYAAGLEDPCAMLAVTDRHGRDPAIRAGQVVLIDGLKSESVTGWPSPGLDLAAPFTRALAPILTAGFYYKTLKWPNWSWYEPFVRRATGFGRPLGRPDRRRRARRYDTCDVLIGGAGPAGLAAAAALTGSGRDVVLADQEPQPGGSLRWENARIDGRKGYVWAEDVRTAFEEGGGRYLQSTCVTGAYEGNVFTLIETRLDEGGVAGETLWTLRADAVVLATGAVDRPLVFQNYDRPGVMLSAARVE
jgi:sarcosine oxidase subunit alpha